MSRGSIIQPSTDPLSVAYKAFNDQFFAHAKIVPLVKAGNRIRFDSDDPQPDRTAGQTADAPSFAARPAAIQGPFPTTCSTLEVRMTFKLELNSGDMRANRGLFPLRFAVMQALYDIRGKNIPYVRSIVSKSDESEESQDYQVNKGTDAWTSVCTIEMIMEFPRAGFSAL